MIIYFLTSDIRSKLIELPHDGHLICIVTAVIDLIYMILLMFFFQFKIKNLL